MKYFNFHTHTLYCDGKNAPEDFIQTAIKKNMSAIGFSSHSPLPFKNTYCIKANRVEDYKNEIRELQKKYANKINVFLALEFDYVPELSDDFSILKNSMGLDYTIGSVHLVKNKKSGKLWFIDGPEINYTSGLSAIFDNDIKFAVTSFFEQSAEMINTQKPTIIGHFDKIKMHNRNRFFKETEIWYIKLVKQTLDIIRKSGSIIEVNTRGIYKKRSDSLYPGEEILTEILKSKIPITISADAHEPHELTSYYPEAIGNLKDIGFKKIKYFTGKSWDDCEIF